MSLAFQGDYTADLFNASKRYKLQYQKQVALADSELREERDAGDSFIRQLIKNNFPDRSSTNDGFKVIESSTDNTNNFTIKGGDGTVNGAGVLFVDGYILFLKSDIEYQDQNNTGALTDDDYTETSISALTTPGAGDRTDTVYVDFYFAEVSSTVGSEYQDSSLTVSGIGSSTANRIRQVQDILVAEGASKPASGTDGNGIYHWRTKIATINRLNGNATITDAMIVDERILINSVQSLALGTTQTDLIMTDGQNIGDATHGVGTLYMASTVDYGSDLTFESSGEKIRFTTGGNVGIRTNNPLADLHINSSSGGSPTNVILSRLGEISLDETIANIEFRGVDSIFTNRIGAVIKATADDGWGSGATEDAPTRLEFYTQVDGGSDGLASPRVTIKGSGFVGIGTAPQTLFHVGAGTTRLDGDLDVNGTTTTINTEVVSTDKITINQDENEAALDINKTAVSGGNAVEIDNAGTGNAMIVTGSGSHNVGIGTNDPQGELHVHDSVANTTLRVQTEASNGIAQLQFQNDARHWQIRVDGTNGDKFLIRDNNAGAIRTAINASGFVGIGTDNPDSKLHLLSTTGAVTDINLTYQSNTLTDRPRLKFYHKPLSGTTQADTLLGQIVAKGDDGNGESTGARIDFLADDEWGTSGDITDAPTRIEFLTAQNASSTAIKRMVIKNNGRVGIGTDAPKEVVHIWNGDSGQATLNSNADEVVLEKDGHCGLTLLSGTGDTGNIYFGSAVDNSSGRIVYKHNTHDLIFTQNLIETVRFTGNGLVGIGTFDPQGDIHVGGSGASNICLERVDISVVADNDIGNLIFRGGELTVQTVASVTARAEQNWTDTRSDTYMTFSTTKDLVLSERMRIKAGGFVGIATTNPQTLFHVGAGTTRLDGDLTVNGTTTTINTETVSTDKITINQDENEVALEINKIGAAGGTAVEIDNTGTGHAMIITGSGSHNVGIGTTVTKGSVHIYDGNSGRPAVHGSGDNFIIEDADAVGMTLLCPESYVGSIYFGDNSQERPGKIQYDHSSNAMFFHSNNLERMRISSSGQVGIGTDAPKGFAHIHNADSGQATIDGDANELIIENSAACGMTILSGASNSGVIYFGDSSNNRVGRIIYSHSTNHIQFNTNDTEAMRLTSGNSMGVNTSAPKGRIHAWSADSGQATPSTSADELVLEGNSSSGLTILSGNTAAGSIFFGDSGDEDIGRIRYNHSDNSMLFSTNVTEKMRITSDGEVGIGSSAPDRTLVVDSGSDGSIAEFVTDLDTSANPYSGGISVLNKDTTTNSKAGIRFMTTETDSNTRILTAGIAGVLTTPGTTATAIGADMIFWTNKAADGNYSEKMRITDGGSVGIGESDPDTKLHVKTASSGGGVSSHADELMIEGSANSGLTISSGNASQGSIFFGDSGSTSIGQIRYDHNGDYMRFITNNAQQMRIESGGDVGIGTTNPLSKLDVQNGSTRSENGFTSLIQQIAVASPGDAVSIDRPFCVITNSNDPYLQVGNIADGSLVWILNDSGGARYLEFDGNSGKITSFTDYPDGDMIVFAVYNNDFYPMTNSGIF